MILKRCRSYVCDEITQVLLFGSEEVDGIFVFVLVFGEVWRVVWDKLVKRW